MLRGIIPSESFPAPETLGRVQQSDFSELKELSLRYGNMEVSGSISLRLEVPGFRAGQNGEITVLNDLGNRKTFIKCDLESAIGPFIEEAEEWLGLDKPRQTLMVSYSHGAVDPGMVQRTSGIWHRDRVNTANARLISATDTLGTEYAVGQLTGISAVNYARIMRDYRRQKEGSSNQIQVGQEIDRIVKKAVKKGTMVIDPTPELEVRGFDNGHMHRSKRNTTGKAVIRNFVRIGTASL